MRSGALPLICKRLTVAGMAVFAEQYDARPARQESGTKKTSRQDYAQGFVGALEAVERVYGVTGLLKQRPGRKRAVA